MAKVDLNHIAMFVRVVEDESFSAAAKALGLPKSSVSRSVARLEEDLGVRLLHRTTRKLSLTEAGRAFFDRVRDPMAGLDEAMDEETDRRAVLLRDVQRGRVEGRAAGRALAHGDEYGRRRHEVDLPYLLATVIVQLHRDEDAERV